MRYNKLLLKTEQEYVDFLLANYCIEDIEYNYGIEFSYGGKFYSELDDEGLSIQEDLNPDRDSSYKKLEGFEFPEEYPCLIQTENHRHWDGTDLGFSSFNGFFYGSDFN